MKNFVYFFSIFCFLAFQNPLNAQDHQSGPMVSIKGYKNANNKKVAKKPIKAELVLDLPNIKLYKAFVSGNITTKKSSYPVAGGGTHNVYGDVDVSDTFWYCLRPGEDIAYVVSWTFNTQVNKNNVFRKNAAEYFKDYPALSNKIKKKEYKHKDIIQVIEEYNNWKSGK